jgi:hypothetical protein
MTQDGKPVVNLSGVVDLGSRDDSITLSAAFGQKRYRPYEVRFVDGWNYVEIEPGVSLPPGLPTGTRWVRFRQLPGVLPVPDRAMPPIVPIDVINLPLTQPMSDAHYVDGPGIHPTQVSVRFGRGPYSAQGFTYSIDGSGRVAAVTSNDVARGGGGGSTFTLTYGPSSAVIVSPSTAVQTLVPGENLYATPTTASTS